VIPLETFRVALRALLRNKLRSFLTVLGIIIGVGAVIAMVAIGEGAKAQVEASFASMGSNLLIVMSGSTQSGGARGGFGSMPTLTWDDLAAIRREAPSVKYAAATLRSTAQRGAASSDRIRFPRYLRSSQGLISRCAFASTTTQTRVT